ncbi:MAG: anhydro-N-acetylmuramic acid kinase [Bacteroidetes bacterium GWF2_33_16]|nr:MAG: anhydro-N-acetylmuramic acid kinase [Bacteroidetes bacterium GWE2_32_14]OFY02943.1 MAG: anhydro-N-acetylmuramic acid kinase [Bacteroidetes bacterium GWF2_33_16]
MQFYNAIGIMSGTSLDGLDIVWTQFWFDSQWKFTIKKAITYKYEASLKFKLTNAPLLNGFELLSLNKEFGKYIGLRINDFLKDIDTKIDFIASHGHTVFHQPDKGITLQIGDGNEITTRTGITTICDFRSKDVALGGQGAPLVPIGDKLLFSDYDYCLNIGGFANISFDKNSTRLAFDICPANIVLNSLANKLGFDFDKNGEMAHSGNLCNEMYDELNEIEYYRKPFPKSLGREWNENIFLPILEKYTISIEDKLNTVCHHIAFQIAESTRFVPSGKMLITGGGAFNTFLIDVLKQKTKNQIIIPENTIIEYKEALIFAFLGLLRVNNQINCLASVTGAKRDSICGVIYIL